MGGLPRLVYLRLFSNARPHSPGRVAHTSTEANALAHRLLRESVRPGPPDRYPRVNQGKVPDHRCPGRPVRPRTGRLRIFRLRLRSTSLSFIGRSRRPDRVSRIGCEVPVLASPAKAW